jgi:hypothetical protein
MMIGRRGVAGAMIARAGYLALMSPLAVRPVVTSGLSRLASRHNVLEPQADEHSSVRKGRGLQLAPRHTVGAAGCRFSAPVADDAAIFAARPLRLGAPMELRRRRRRSRHQGSRQR